MIERYNELAKEHEPRISNGIDFYKLTMGQIALEQFSGTNVTFTLKNRDEARPISEFVNIESLRSRLDYIRQKGFDPEEIAYFGGIKAQDGSARFDEQYLNFLETIALPEVSVAINEKSGELDINTTGDWAAVSLWETIIMNEANEQYYKNMIQKDNLDINNIFAHGDEVLSQKIDILKKRPDIKFLDFGTRRRFSAAWQEHVLERLVNELPDNLIGTSNPWLAYKFNIRPVGTYAHEMPMVYAALADSRGEKPLDSHMEMMNDWFARYGEDLSIALTDTFTSDFFFTEFTPEQANSWRGLRHDSGDPFEFGERVINFYEKANINPMDKTLIFSDGLDIDMIIKLADHFKNRINIVYGWGTSLMNDMGFKSNNIVMKATKANDKFTVKLSDNEGKHIGPEDLVNNYINDKNLRIIGKKAIQGVISI